MIPRAAWGARPPKSTTPRHLSTITTAHVHYSDGPPPDAITEAATVRAIQNFHMDGRGWWDIGYHRLISPTGTIFEGRPLDCVGAETEGHNQASAGYCFLTDGPVTPAAWAAFTVQLAADENAIGHQLAVRPHSADYPTACPGDTLRALIPTAHQTTSPPEPPPPPPAPIVAPTPPSPPQPTTDPLEAQIVQLPVLRPGVPWSKDTSKVQGLLIAQGTPPADGHIDGFYGPMTESAVMAFQRRTGLAVDGIVGPDTWTHLVGD